MSNSMSVVCLVLTKNSTKGFINGTAIYRNSSNSKKHFDFRLFDNGSNKNIQHFEEGDVVSFNGKFSYRKDFENENPMFLSVNQVIVWPCHKKTPWTSDNIPISNPYITASVFLAKNPLGTHNDYDIIKSTCNNVFCSFNRTKYDHNFYLNYSKDTERWTKTIQTIKQGNIRIYISGFYKGHSPKEERNTYHLIQLTELDFESKFNNTFNTDDDDDDDGIFFRTSIISDKPSEKSSKKHDLPISESSESSESSSENSDSSTLQKKKKRKKKKKKKTSASDKPVKIKHELSYKELLSTRKTDINENFPQTDTLKPPPQYNYYNPNVPPPTYYYPPYYHPPPHDFNKVPDLKEREISLTSPISKENSSISEIANESTSKDKRVVQFNLPNEDHNQDDIQDIQQSHVTVETLDNNKSTRSTRGKGTKNTKKSNKNSKKQPSIRKSPRKKGGILDIAVSKIIEINDDDDDPPQKSDHSFMDTESDYQTQNEEEMCDDDDSN